MGFKDLTGRVFGRLTVICFIKRQGRHSYWKCKCECGKEKITIGNNLIRKKTTSCGCLRIEQATQRLKNVKRIKFEEGVGSCNMLWNRYKQSAKRRGLVFEINRQEFMEITSKPCHYCNTPPKLTIKGENCNGAYVFNGIDRIDNNLGYIANNIVPCCRMCNYAKHTISYPEFMEWIKNLTIRAHTLFD